MECRHNLVATNKILTMKSLNIESPLMKDENYVHCVETRFWDVLLYVARSQVSDNGFDLSKPRK